MTPSHIEHIAIAVTDLDEALKYWENVMGLKCYAIEEVTDNVFLIVKDPFSSSVYV